MAVDDEEIANFLRGDSSDLEEFDESANDKKESDILNAITDMNDFRRQNAHETNKYSVNLMLNIDLSYYYYYCKYNRYCLIIWFWNESTVIFRLMVIIAIRHL